MLPCGCSVPGPRTRGGYYEPAPTPPCPEGTIEFTIDPPYGEKTYTLPGTDDKLTVKVYDQKKFDWWSQFKLLAVIAMAGHEAEEYEYPTGAYKGYDLQVGGYKPRKLTKIKFCYELALKVSKTAEADVKVKYDWEIKKTAYPRDSYDSYDRTLTVDYKVELKPMARVEDVVIKGKIMVENKTKFEAKIVEIKDKLSDGSDAEVDCKRPVSSQYPVKLGPGDKLECWYTAYPKPYTELAGLKNTVHVKTAASSKVRGDSATVPVTVKDPSKAIDRCVHLTDALEGSSYLELDKKVCADDPYLTFEYYRTFDLKCGDNWFKNVAKIVGKDTYRVWTDHALVDKYVKCDGCTRTQGYWKTHSKCGPVGEDPTWCLLGAKCSKTQFFNNKDVAWCEVLDTPAKGNMARILARDFIAGKLNKVNVDVPKKVENALKAAEQFFRNCSLESWQSTPDCADKSTLEAWKEILSRFNEGLEGPKHCE